MQQPTTQAVAAILEKAGRDILLPAFVQAEKASSGKRDGSIVTATDLACQQSVRAALAAAWPDIAFLGEEMSADEQHAALTGGNRLWCLDPLDGTTNFVANVPGFALSLALIEQGRPRLACIVDPVRGETFTAAEGCGAFMGGDPLRAESTVELADSVGYIDFKRLNARHRAMLVEPGHYRSQRNLGSCALEWAWLAAGRGQFIVHGGEKLWDFAAGSLLAAEAGCTLSDFDGHPLFDAVRPSSSILAATSQPLHGQLIQLLGKAMPPI